MENFEAGMSRTGTSTPLFFPPEWMYRDLRENTDGTLSPFTFPYFKLSIIFGIRGQSHGKIGRSHRTTDSEDSVRSTSQ